MLEAGVKVCLGITVHRQNEADLEHVLDYAVAKGILDVDVRRVYPNSMPDEPVVNRGIQTFNHCHASLYQLYIESDGSVFPCCITAGDTRGKPEGYALGNFMYEPWPDIWARVIEYSRKELKDLPPICRTCCVQRLSEINHVCDAIPTGQSFF
jgi:radical SAM protein with 4Fe4S-binding SPASM domain